jgi:hypothetical protein
MTVCDHKPAWRDSAGKCSNCGEHVGRGHEHITARDQLGQNVCTVCGTIVIEPIFSSDDPRLQPPAPEPVYAPTPEVLVALYYAGPENGYPRAPIAPYVRDIAAFEGNIKRYDPDELWEKLSALSS